MSQFRYTAEVRVEEVADGEVVGEGSVTYKSDGFDISTILVKVGNSPVLQRLFEEMARQTLLVVRYVPPAADADADDPATAQEEPSDLVYGVALRKFLDAPKPKPAQIWILEKDGIFPLDEQEEDEDDDSDVRLVRSPRNPEDDVALREFSQVGSGDEETPEEAAHRADNA